MLACLWQSPVLVNRCDQIRVLREYNSEKEFCKMVREKCCQLAVSRFTEVVKLFAVKRYTSIVVLNFYQGNSICGLSEVDKAAYCVCT